MGGLGEFLVALKGLQSHVNGAAAGHRKTRDGVFRSTIRQHIRQDKQLGQIGVRNLFGNVFIDLSDFTGPIQASWKCTGLARLMGK